jgi:hypothetical protein
MSVESFADSLRVLYQKSGVATPTIEVVGRNRDLYLNVLPLLFDVKVVYNGLSDKLQPTDCNNVQAIVQDEDLEAECQSPYIIVKSKGKWTLDTYVPVDILTPLKDSEKANVRYW